MKKLASLYPSATTLQDAIEVLPRMQPYRTMTTILSEHSRGISNSLTLSNRFIVLKMTETYSVSTLQAVQLTFTKQFSVFYTSKQETQACIHIYRKCTENPDDSLHHLLNLIKRITLLKGGEKHIYKKKKEIISFHPNENKTFIRPFGNSK